MAESVLEMAQRHVTEGEERVARQEAILSELERDNHAEAADHARSLLATMRETLRLAREHLEHERGKKRT